MKKANQKTTFQKVFITFGVSILVLTFVIIGFLVLSTVLAKPEIVYTQNADGTYTLSEVKHPSKLEGDIIIPEQYNGASVTAIGDRAFSGCESITSVTVPDSVTSVGQGAFAYCSSLVHINLPEGIIEISNNAFQGCASLTSFTIPDSVTRLGSQAFEKCTSLSSITIPKSVTIICFDAFSDCTSLTKVEYMGDLESWINISFELFSSPLRNGVDLFLNGEILTDLVIPDTVTVLGDDFVGCTSLVSVTLPKSIENLSSQFDYCTSLKSINIPDSVKRVELPLFKGCSSLEEISVSKSHPTMSVIDGNLYNKDKNSLIKYAPGKTATSFTVPDGVTDIAPYAFSDCTSLESITIPGTVRSVGAAFEDCTSLKSIHFDGTIEQWERLTMGYVWNGMTVTVYCTDGTISE